MQGNQSPLSPAREYERRLELRRSSLAELDQRYRTLGNLRVVVVFAAIAITYFAVARQALSGWWLLAPFAACGRPLASAPSFFSQTRSV
jgi:hypothetical protein